MIAPSIPQFIELQVRLIRDLYGDQVSAATLDRLLVGSTVAAVHKQLAEWLEGSEIDLHTLVGRLRSTEAHAIGYLVGVYEADKAERVAKEKKEGVH